MNILQINTEDAKGGAANLTYAVHNTLRSMGYNSKMLVSGKHTDDPDVYQTDPLTRLPRSINYRLRKRTGYDFWRVFPFGWLGREPIASADIINLHNIHGNYFNYFALPKLTENKRVCWSLHDMWSFTGNCAYSYECDRWIKGCHDCPLHTRKENNRPIMEPSPLPHDRSESIWKIKRWLYERSKMTIIVGSQWMKTQVEKSILQPVGDVVLIPDGADLDLFKSLPQARISELRREYNIPDNAKVILVYASALPRKATHLAAEALMKMEADPNIVIFSMGWQAAPYEDVQKKYRIINIGYTEDDVKRNELHNMADVLLMPTMQDNLSLAMLDSLASGLPIVAFKVGGIPEGIIHMQTGYLATTYNTQELADGLNIILKDAKLRQNMRLNAREHAEKNFDHNVSVRRYADLYQSIMDSD